MTVQAIRPGGEVVAALGRACEGVAAAASIPGLSLGEGELVEAVERASVLENQVAALKLGLLAEAERRALAKRLGATGTDAWAGGLTGTSRGVMAGGLWLARLLEEKYSATREAFAAGGINQAQARVIVRAAEQLPTSVSDEQRKAAEAGLVAKAVHGMDAKGLRRAARRMLDKVASLTREQVDGHEADQLEREEQRAERESNFAMWDNGDGTWSGKFTIPEAQASVLKAFLERLCFPPRLATNRAGQTVSDETVETGANTYERQGRAFSELIEHLPAGGFGRGGIGVMVHLDYRHLLDGLASARVDTGVDISVGQARRLACTGAIIPTVLDGDSVVLDLGRSRRLHTTSQARALSVTYETCATEGCGRPFAWCDIHHLHPWSRGGSTDLANAIPLCGWHHRRAHDTAFNMRHLLTGEVRFTRRR
jgi:hypothetical protein